ncbi:R3H domain-containing protein 1-like isoform X2 [Gouania willdenowi]|uniref:R3H domain-containing protein 1-like isoform X2 n=1 Tax=Gouania willdenowi TaxID=441366 RepID=UPI001054A269|nr:R3H domain-containing protein 1-like isoform X2 [Gouania willdenowi]
MMRMSDSGDTDVMKVPEAAACVTPTKDQDTPRTNVSEQSPSSSSSSSKTEAQPVKYSKSNTRLKLVRSLAMCEESFPCPFPEPSEAPQDGVLVEKEEGVAQREEESCDKAEKMPRKMLSRDSSQDYTDSTGIDLHEFLVNTLQGNPRDRIMLLKLEQDILDFISNNESQKRKFPPMTSYHRMLLHRVAAYFGMDHNVDPSGKSVVINKTSNTRIPNQKFSEHIKDDRADDFQKRYILKRDNTSFDRDDSSIRMRLKADKRSKSMEEREEEYQRARERIFAHDGDHFILDRSAQDEDVRIMSSHQRRQMFRLRASQSGTSHQSSSETDTLARHSEPRPWSSTESSDSSNRLAPRPPMTKASSFSGISPCLVRGDSTASSRSTGRLSKTGSESCSSSVGSSSSSLSRLQLPLPLPLPVPVPVPGSSRSSLPSTPLIHPEKSVVSTEGTNYLVLPLEASGIPGSVLVHPHTGKPFIHPDGSAVVYSPVGVASAAGRIQQQVKAPQQPITAGPQPQPANQLLPQPPSDSAHPMLSYSLAPPTPSQLLPVCPNQQFTVPDALNTQFSHMTLTQQQPSEGGALAPDPRHFPSIYHQHHHHPSPVLLHAPPLQQVTSYVVAAPSGGPSGILQGQPVHNQGPNHALSLLTQPLHQQQHAYVQQPPQQMSTCYCASGLHPHCSAHQQQQQHPYRLPYAPPQSINLPQQQVHHAMMSNPSSYQTLVGLQQTPTLALTGNQQSNMGNQVQGMVVQYPQMQAYHQVSVPQQQYQSYQSYQQHQQPVIMSCQPGIQPCYSLLPPHQHQHATMSSTVSFLPGSMVDQLQLSQAASPCVSQQHAGPPQYAGLLPPTPGGGMLMLQMTTPSCQQPRDSSPCQRKQQSSAHKHSRVELHRGRRPAELLPPLDPPQSSLPLSPALPRPPSAKGLHAIPVMSHPLPTAFCHSGPGDTHFSLLGRPLQYTPSIQPPLLHSTTTAAANHMFTKHQGSLGVWRSAHGKKANRKCQSVDVGVAEQVTSQDAEERLCV